MRSRFFPLMAVLSIALSAPAQAADQAPPKLAAHKVTQSKSYLAIDPLYATITSGERPRGLLEIIIGLDIPDSSLHESAVRAMPILRDAYVRNMMAFAATRVRVTQQPDVTMIADRLQAITDRVLQKKGARVLLIQVALSAPH
jgi:hypothetical protein